MSLQPRSETLGRAASRGAAWAFLSTALARTVSLVALSILARLLTPEDFGTVALALVFITYAETIGDLGAGAALIYWPRQRDQVAGVAFWIGIAMSWVWWLAAQLAAPWLADFFHNPEAESILQVLAFTFPLKALANTHDALCQKDLRFRSRMLAEVSLFGGKALVSIVLALAGFGVWSLVGGQLAGTACWALALWRIVPWRPFAKPSRELMTPLLRYGRSIVAVNVIAAVVHHADLVVVGRMLGTQALGLYQVAYKVPEITIALLVWVVGKVLFPTFAKLQDSPAALRAYYLNALQFVGALALPAAVGLFLLAEPLVLVAFGPQWRPSVPILRAIAVYMGLRALGSHAGDVLKGTGRPGLLAGLGLLKAGVLLPTLIWAGGFEAQTVAWAQAVVTIFSVALNLWIVSRLLDFSPRLLLVSLQPFVLPVLAMSGALVFWLRAAGELGPLLTVLIAVPAGIAVYTGTLALIAPDTLQRARRSLFPSHPQGSPGEPTKIPGVTRP